MSAQILSFPRASTPRVAQAAWKPVAGGVADFCGVRVDVVTVGYFWTVVDYADGEGKWRKDVRTQPLKPWRGEDCRPSDSPFGGNAA